MKALKITSAQLQNDHTGFDRLARFFEETLGLRFDLSAQNRPLFCSRFAQLMNEFSIGSFEQLLEQLLSQKDRRDDRLFRSFVHATTTHTTEFFREPAHFDFLRVWFRQRISGNGIDFSQKTLRIWCAAASTGEEPISVLMTLLDLFPNLSEQVELEILATDIDEEVLKNAEAGFYNLKDLGSVSQEQLERYFVPIEQDAVLKSYRVKPRYTDLIQYRPLNLTETDFQSFGKFDLILCRNVLIYFSETRAKSAIHGLIQALQPNGILILDDVDESWVGNQHMERLLPAVFAKRQ